MLRYSQLDRMQSSPFASPVRSLSVSFSICLLRQVPLNMGGTISVSTNEYKLRLCVLRR